MIIIITPRAEALLIELKKKFNELNFEILSHIMHLEKLGNDIDTKKEILTANKVDNKIATFLEITLKNFDHELFYQMFGHAFSLKRNKRFTASKIKIDVSVPEYLNIK
jgi:hypothetical protein